MHIFTAFHVHGVMIMTYSLKREVWGFSTATAPWVTVSPNYCVPERVAAYQKFTYVSTIQSYEKNPTCIIAILFITCW